VAKQQPIPVGGVWLDAHSGRIRVRVEINGEWRDVIDERNDEGHISHIVEPAGITDSPKTVFSA
jgi:hypothetical protein